MIHAGHIRLRYAERAGLTTLVKSLTDPEVRGGLDRAAPRNLAREERWFEASPERDPSDQLLAIDLNAKRVWQPVGSRRPSSVNKRARHAEPWVLIGDKSGWGQGIGADSRRRLLGHAFGTLNLNRVHLPVLADNERALRLFHKVGFVEAGRLCEDSLADGQ